jgi:hypothetical protein
VFTALRKPVALMLADGASEPELRLARAGRTCSKWQEQIEVLITGAVLAG